MSCKAGTTDEILSAMFYSLFLDDEVRLQLSRYESLAVMNWQDLNKDASVLVNLYGAASSIDAGAFWVKSTIVAGSDNGSEPGNGIGGNAIGNGIGGSGAGNGIGGGEAGTGIGSTRAGDGIRDGGEGNGVGGSGAGNGFGDSGEGNGIDASGASNGIHGSGAGNGIGKASAAVDRSSSRSHAVYNNNDPVFAEYVGLTYERWALSRSYQMALRLTLSEAGHLPYSDMFVDFDTQVRCALQ